MRTIQCALAVCAIVFLGCPDGDELPGTTSAGSDTSTSGSDTSGSDTSGSDTSTSGSDATGDAASTATKVTVTSYILEDGTYTAAGTPLVFEVGVPCQTWERNQPQPDAGNPNPNHPHYNAATDVAFDGTTLTWTEFGPEHEDGVVGPLCESGTGGASKTATTDDYTAATQSADNKAYLKVTAVE